MEESQIQLTKSRHIGLWIIAFVLVALTGATLMILSLFGAFQHIDGYVALAATGYSDVTNYTDGVTCALYFKGNGMQVNSQVKTATAIYSETLKKTHMQLDAYNQYPSTSSIADINNNVGKNVEVNEYVYNTLLDAYTHSKTANNYSLFAQPLMDEWDNIIYNHASGVNMDPLVDPSENDYLIELASLIHDETNFSLEFKDNHTICLKISEAYQEFRESNEIVAPILSLNSLLQAYEIKELAKVLEEQGYTDGYLASYYGVGMTLKGCQGLNHNINTYVDGLKDPGYVKIEGQHVYAKFHRFDIGQTTFPNAYVIKRDGNTYFRSGYLKNETGFPTDYYLSSELFASGTDVVSIALKGLETCLVDNEETNANFLSNLNGVKALIINKNSPKTVQISGINEENITLYYPDEYQIAKA